LKGSGTGKLLAGKAVEGFKGRPFDVCSGKVGTGEIQVLKIGSLQILVREIGPAEVAAVESDER